MRCSLLSVRYPIKVLRCDTLSKNLIRIFGDMIKGDSFQATLIRQLAFFNCPLV